MIARIFWLFYFCFAAAGTVLLGFFHMPPALSWSSALYLCISAVAGFLLLASKYGVPRGLAMSLLLGISGFVVEMAGVHTGWPFGRYRYTPVLGVDLFGVPLSMAGAWILTGALAHLTSTQLCMCRAKLNKWVMPFTRTVLAGALLCVALDALLDPVASQILREWIWLKPGLYYGVPASNFRGWFLVCLVLQTALWLLAGQQPRATGTTILAFRYLAGTFTALITLFTVSALRAGLWFPILLTTIPWCVAFTMIHARLSTTVNREDVT